MNWTHFLFWIGGLYSLYYLTVILSDLMRERRKNTGGLKINELTFSDDEVPVRFNDPAQTPEEKSLPSTDVTGSGGVPISDLFRLAKQEAIIYTRSVSF